MPLAEIGECTKQVIAGENRNPTLSTKILQTQKAC